MEDAAGTGQAGVCSAPLAWRARDLSPTVGEKGVPELLSSHQRSRGFLAGTAILQQCTAARKACGGSKAGADTDE